MALAWSLPCGKHLSANLITLCHWLGWEHLPVLGSGVCFLGVWRDWEYFELAFLRRLYGTFGLWFGIPWFRKLVLRVLEGNQEKPCSGNQLSGCCHLQGLTTSCRTSTSSTSPCCLCTEKHGMSTSVRGSTAWPGRSTASACPTAYSPMFTDVPGAQPARPSHNSTKSRRTHCWCTDRISRFGVWVRTIEPNSSSFL